MAMTAGGPEQQIITDIVTRFVDLLVSAVLINLEQALSTLSSQLRLNWLTTLQCSSATGACVHSVVHSFVYAS